VIGVRGCAGLFQRKNRESAQKPQKEFLLNPFAAFAFLSRLLR
jgi:hypothetical protein